ncbi:hypothetical protein [Pseudomonas sp. IT-P294]|uniref:hypothetical protein n=1 Tax=Pseudomonas sp. IT-P294 TaxID=3026454 RepID=UPI0039E0B505
MISPFFHGAVPHLELEISTMDRRVDALREGFYCVLRVRAFMDWLANLIQSTT